MKVICSVKDSHFLVAMIDDNASNCTAIDTDLTHCSFAVFGVEPADFAQAIVDLYKGWEDCIPTQQITLPASRTFDTIYFTREGSMICVNRGNIKTLYFENIHNLMHAVKPLLKANEKYEKSLEEFDNE